jgi:hypothetical protein
MTQKLFSIEYWWEKQDTPDQLGDHSEWPVVMQALFAFLTDNKGGFRIKAGAWAATFELMPDLSSIFADLPHVLGTLQQQDGVSVELDMFAQGTDVGIAMRRQGDEILMRFETAPGSGEPYQLLDDEELAVSAPVFLLQWQRFVLAILDAMSKTDPSACEDESFIAYRDTIRGLTMVDEANA